MSEDDIGNLWRIKVEDYVRENYDFLSHEVSSCVATVIYEGLILPDMPIEYCAFIVAREFKRKKRKYRAMS